MNITFNYALGSAVELARFYPNGGVMIFLEAAEDDAALRDHADLASLLAASGNTELSTTGYVRKTGLALTINPDGTISIPAQTFSGIAAGGTVTKVIVGIATGGTDADIVPVSAFDASILTDGSNIVINFFNGHFYESIQEQTQSADTPHTDITVSGLASAPNNFDMVAQFTATGGNPAGATFAVSIGGDIIVTSAGLMTIPGSIADGNHVGTVTATNAAGDHTRNLTVAMSSPVAGQRHVEITVEGHAPVVADLVSVAPAPSGDTLSTFTLENTGTADSRGEWIGGLAFPMGDVPSSQVPVIERSGTPVQAQFDARTTWPDGSLKYAVATLRDADIAGTRAYAIKRAVGSYDDTASVSLAQIIAAYDLQVDLSNMTFSGGASNSVYRATAVPGANHYVECTYVRRTFGQYFTPIIGCLAADGSTGIGCRVNHTTDQLRFEIGLRTVDENFDHLQSWVVTGSNVDDYDSATIRLEFRRITDGVEVKMLVNGALKITRNIINTVDNPNLYTPFDGVNGVGLVGFPYVVLTAWRAGTIGGTETTNLNLAITDRALSAVSGMALVSGVEAARVIGGELHLRGEDDAVTSWSGSFADAAAVATRLSVIASGPIRTSYKAWAYVTGSLRIIWRVDGFSDGAGGISHVRVSVQMQQDTAVASDKYARYYNFTLRNGATTIQTVRAEAIPHVYHAGWVALRPDDDAQHATPHWIGASVPTLHHRMDKAYWARSGVLPPLRTTTTVTAGNYARTYIPMINFDHRMNTNGTGAYDGRGPITVHDARDFASQTPESRRQAIVNAFAGLHKPYHITTDALRQRPGDAAPDIAHTVVSLEMAGPYVTDPSEYDFQVDGMPAPVIMSTWEGKEVNYSQVQGGGSNGWAIAFDTSHASSYSYYAYVVTGEDYFLDCVISTAVSKMCRYPAQYCGKQSAGTLAKGPQWNDDADRRAAFGIPNDQSWSGLWPNGYFMNPRQQGWWMLLMGHAVGIVPDNRPEARMLKRWNAHNARHLQDSIPYYPQSQRDTGWVSAYSPTAQYYMLYFIGLGAYMNYTLTRDAGMEMYANIVAKVAINLAKRSPFMLDAYFATTVPDGTGKQGWKPGNDYLRSDLCPVDYYEASCGISDASTGLFYWHSNLRFPVVTGDKFQFGTDLPNTTPYIPPEFSHPTIYYAVDVDTAARRFRLSTTPGGAAISPITPIPQGRLMKLMVIEPQGALTVTDTYNWGGADAYPAHAWALIAHAKSWGHPEVTQALVDELRVFIDTYVPIEGGAWDYEPVVYGTP